MDHSSLSSPELAVDKGDTGINVVEVPKDGKQAKPKRGLYFWLTFLAICVSLFMSALEVVSTAIPQRRDSTTRQHLADHNFRIQDRDVDCLTHHHQ